MLIISHDAHHSKRYATGQLASDLTWPARQGYNAFTQQRVRPVILSRLLFLS